MSNNHIFIHPNSFTKESAVLSTKLLYFYFIWHLTAAKYFMSPFFIDVTTNYTFSHLSNGNDLIILRYKQLWKSLKQSRQEQFNVFTQTHTPIHTYVCPPVTSVCINIPRRMLFLLGRILFCYSKKYSNIYIILFGIAIVMRTNV